MKSCFYIVVFTLFFGVVGTSNAQDNIRLGKSDLMYGFSGKAIVDLPYKNKNINLRLSVASGLGYSFYKTNFSSINVEFSTVFSGMGTYKNDRTSYFCITPHLTQSFDRSAENTADRNQPLYYFTDLVTPPLQNPFQNSISIGSNFIKLFNPHLTNPWQIVAHGGFKINKVHVVYNNDGGPILKYWGDKKDRYFTGSGFAHVHLDDHLILNNFGLSFYKFTGYTNMSFELSDELLYASVDYKEANQNFFNYGFWNVSLGNTTYGNIAVRYNNPPSVREFQNLIHYSKGNSYHLNVNSSDFSVALSPSCFQTYLPSK